MVESDRWAGYARGAESERVAVSKGPWRHRFTDYQHILISRINGTKNGILVDRQLFKAGDTPKPSNKLQVT